MIVTLCIYFHQPSKVGRQHCSRSISNRRSWTEQTNALIYTNTISLLGAIYAIAYTMVVYYNGNVFPYKNRRNSSVHGEVNQQTKYSNEERML